LSSPSIGYHIGTRQADAEYVARRNRRRHRAERVWGLVLGTALATLAIVVAVEIALAAR
jgi:hypothetical protein